MIKLTDMRENLLCQKLFSRQHRNGFNKISIQFTKQHEDRYVNSIYFDNKYLDQLKRTLMEQSQKKKLDLDGMGPII